MSDTKLGYTRNFRPNFKPQILAIAVLTTVAISPPAKADEWQKSITMYGLVPWLDVGVEADSGHTSDASADPGDIIDALDFTFMASGEFRKGKTSLLFDLMYTDLGSSGTLAGPTSGTIDVDTKMILASVAIGHDISHADSYMTQIFGGFRYVNLDTSITAVGGGPVGAGINADVNEDYFEPLVGIRGSKRINDRMSLVGIANIGGFGFGSDLTVDLYGWYQYSINEKMSANIGFRYISIDYSADNGDIDMDMYGPVFGITRKF